MTQQKNTKALQGHVWVGELRPKLDKKLKNHSDDHSTNEREIKGLGMQQQNRGEETAITDF